MTTTTKTKRQQPRHIITNYNRRRCNNKRCCKGCAASVAWAVNGIRNPTGLSPVTFQAKKDHCEPKIIWLLICAFQYPVQHTKT